MQLLTILFTVVIFVVVTIFSFLTGYNFHKFRELRRQRLEHEAAHTGPHRHEVPETTQIVNGKRYSSMDSKCIAQGSTIMGWAWLMQTNNDNYFIISHTFFGLQAIIPQTLEEAIAFHTSCGIREVSFEQAFPGSKIQDA